MKLTFKLFAFVLVFLLSCEVPEKKPEDILSEEKVSDVMVDMQILEATYNSRLLNLDDRNDRMKRYYDEIFEHHGISEKVFNESYTYYQDHPEQLELIYEMVFEKLEKLLTEEETKNKQRRQKKAKKNPVSKN